MKTFRFLDFKVYQEAKSFHREIVEITKRFPREYFYLVDQLKRCSLSMILNIAEGSAKRSDKDFNRYLENSLGSINEAVACLDVALSVKLINEEKFNDLVLKAESIKKQIGGFSRKLLSSNS
ncbi:hypothetical protein COU95_01865 [Candidatus Shapirobacteria bacterium CG10_big_fil_rev_8_21_14_0_10_40_9]|uniref:Four helix bundle protein n=1 Tax=Candidatus Shapirobacteria bacterium CG10_big_fil_rev_8_21_14_0_10_40_9 TaxID=1974888 RepID=A0A2M8L3P3_9BACT|nr:MAG: hypothetical protein COU95_01865 [Candidatus Shapirobacteria bacterium CG10_big_fil_rev_8_21_14_0_10_40_9]